MAEDIAPERNIFTMMRMYETFQIMTKGKIPYSFKVLVKGNVHSTGIVMALHPQEAEEYVRRHIQGLAVTVEQAIPESDLDIWHNLFDMSDVTIEIKMANFQFPFIWSTI